MKCPVCGKHLAEERYEIHVGRHTDVDVDGPPAEPDDVPVAVGAATSDPLADGAGVNADALLLGHEGSPLPLSDDAGEPAEAEDPEDPEDAADSENVDEEPAAAVEEDASGSDDEDRATVDAPTTIDEDPTLVEADGVDEPVDAPEPAAAWGAPAEPVGGEGAPARRSPLPVLGLLALVVLAAVAVFVLTRDNGTKKSSRVQATPQTSTRPTFASIPSPGSPGGTSPTPTFPPTPGFVGSPPLPVPPPAPGVAPPPGAAPANSPAGAANQIQITPSTAECDQDTGRLSVGGTIANNGSGRSNVQFTVTVSSASGATLGSAQTAVVVGPGERKTFQATGSCSGPLGPGNRQQTQIQSVTPA